MRKKKNVIIGLFIVLSLFWAERSIVHAEEEGFNYVQKLGSGINLGNTLENGLEDLMLDEHSMETIVNNIKSQGFTSIRIPITWQGHWEEGTNVIDADYLSKIRGLVQTAVSRDMYVVLTMYDDSWKWISSTENVLATQELYKSLWSQIASYFADYGEQVCFESVNAPSFAVESVKDQQVLLDQYNAAFVASVRATGGNNVERYLLLPVLNGQVNEDNCKAMSAFVESLKDSRVIVSVQYYGQWNFSVNAAGTTTYNNTAQKHMKDFFKLIKTYFTKKKIPTACVEYGLFGYPLYEDAIDRGERLKYYYELTNKARSAKMGYFLWDTGVLYNRGADTWVDQDLAYVIRQSGRKDYSYGSKDYVYLIDGKDFEEPVIELTLNNATITHLRYNDKVMVQDVDYVISEDKITITKTFLASLQPPTVGLSGTIEVMFSTGPSWKINVYRVGQPELASTGSTGEMLEIPMNEQGNQLVSLEAMTTDQKPVGPLDWTSYQEYGYSFLPDYNNHTLCLTDKFISTLPAGQEILLKCKFRSGLTTEYHIIKDDQGVREIAYDWNAPQPVTPVAPSIEPELKDLVEKENQEVVKQEQTQTAKPEKPNSVKDNSTGWKLLFASFAIMIILGLSVLYIYYTHRKDNLNSVMLQTEDHLEEKIHKILVDKSGKDA